MLSSSNANSYLPRLAPSNGTNNIDYLLFCHQVFLTVIILGYHIIQYLYMLPYSLPLYHTSSVNPPLTILSSSIHTCNPYWLFYHPFFLFVIFLNYPLNQYFYRQSFFDYPIIYHVCLSILSSCFYLCNITWIFYQQIFVPVHFLDYPIIQYFYLLSSLTILSSIIYICNLP